MYFEPSPWLAKVQARRIVFPSGSVACSSEGYGFEAGCSAGDVKYFNLVNPQLRESAPAFYHTMRGRLQISPPALQDMMSRHVEGGGDLMSVQAVACEWMHGNIDTVRSWMPLECETVLIQPDGTTNCCNGEPRRLRPDLPMVCVPKCNESSQVPNMSTQCKHVSRSTVIQL